MPNLSEMTELNPAKYVGAVFITFSGNCRQALTYYQTCFGGTLHFETFEKELEGYTGIPIVCGSLISDNLIIHGSDLVHNEGRTLGNYLSIFLQCETRHDRLALIKKLKYNDQDIVARNDNKQKLVEITDAFDVRWVLGI